jgi:hypothetical protein
MIEFVLGLVFCRETAFSVYQAAWSSGLVKRNAE